MAQVLHRGSVETGLCRWTEGLAASSRYSSEPLSDVAMGIEYHRLQLGKGNLFSIFKDSNWVFGFYWLFWWIKMAKFEGHLKAESGKATWLFIFKAAFLEYILLQNIISLWPVYTCTQHPCSILLLSYLLYRFLSRQLPSHFHVLKEKEMCPTY